MPCDQDIYGEDTKNGAESASLVHIEYQREMSYIQAVHLRKGYETAFLITLKALKWRNHKRSL